MKKLADGSYGYERRRKWLRGGRIDIRLGTRSAKEAKRRTAALDLLLERREEALVEAIRAGRVGVDEVANAVRDEALDALRDKIRAPEPEPEPVAPPEPVRRVDLSLEATIERVLTVQDATRSVGTGKVYRSHTNALRKGFDASRLLPDLSSDELRAWLYAARPRGKKHQRAAKPWAPHTQAAVHMVVSHAWRLAIEAELEDSERQGLPPRITRNPWAAIEPAEARATRHSFLEPLEWVTVLDRQRGTPRAAFLALGCLGGLRINEVLNLRTDIDVELEADGPVLHVQPREGEDEWTTKNDNSIRTVPIPDVLLDVLRDHVRRGYAGARYFIRTARQDSPVSYSWARTWTIESFQAAGLKYGREGESLTYHSLRHTFASWLIREGWSSTLVAQLMGNTSEEVERTYAHLFPKDMRRVMVTMDRLTGASGESSGGAGPAGEWSSNGAVVK